MKRTILIAVIAALVAPIWAQDTGKTPDGMFWQLTPDKKGVVINGYDGKAGAVRIPDKINNLPVVGIEELGFSDNETRKILTSVVIPNTVTTIGSGAFTGCTKLTSVTLPAGLTTIEDSLFRECTALTSITLPATVKTIGPNAFNSCKALTSISLPASITTIGNGAFWYCTALTSINLPTSITTIGSSTFRECTKLTSITLPASITTIGNLAFHNCTALTTVNIPASVTTITFGTNAFQGVTNLNAVTVTALTNRGYKF
jgi:hypothetical protein